MTNDGVLIVDDDAALREMLTSFLANEGFRVQSAANGSEALAIVAQERPRMIILDVSMPVMDGWALVRELRANNWDVPLVVMTAARDARRCADEIGAAAYVVKPVSLPQLLARIIRIGMPAL
jgi:two-component system, OmpR family, response regulator